MGYSIMDIGKSTKSQSKGSLNTLVKMEQNRGLNNKQVDQQEKTNKIGGASTGVAVASGVSTALSAAAGAEVAAAGGSAAAIAGAETGAALGPWGLAIGAGIGYLAATL